MNKKILGINFGVLLLLTAILPVTGELISIKSEKINTYMEEYPLPDPISIDMLLEVSICRRMSIRAFTSEAVTDEELSTILWAAYGYANNGHRTIFSPNGVYSIIIYVIRSDATYIYVPENHSLSLFKTGNYLYVGQYDTAKIKFGLVWDKNIESDEMNAMAQVGMIGQNIYFDANALDLGTVTTGMGVTDLTTVLGLPSNEIPEIIMPLGHPSSPYDFTYSPLPVSNLPLIENNTYSLENVTNNRVIVNNWDNIPLTLFEESQLIWGSYGYSYLLDGSNDRHRTLPSAIDIYPFKVFAANHSGVYQYVPSTHSITTIVQDDRRDEINNSIESQDINVPSASWIIIPCLDTNVGSSQYQTFWYYEVGAITHNVLLEATALTLNANVVTEISDEVGLRSAMGISSQTNLLPWAVIPVGHPSNRPPDLPRYPNPADGAIDVSFNTNLSWTGGDPDGDLVTYDIYFGTISPPPKIVSNHPETTYVPGQLINFTTYYWQIIAFDEFGASTAGPIWSFITTSNYPPSKPTITGPANGKTKIEYDYTFVATDPNNDQLYYYIDWGDGTNTGWLGPYNPEEEIIQSHKWFEKGTYNIRCKAKDVYNDESNWESFQVTMPRIKTNINSLLLRLIKEFLKIPLLNFYP